MNTYTYGNMTKTKTKKTDVKKQKSLNKEL